MEKFAELYAPGIYTVEKQEFLVSINLKKKIDNNKPVIYTMFNYLYSDGGTDKTSYSAHAVVVYGYRPDAVLCHYGQSNKNNVWIYAEALHIGFVEINDETEHRYQNYQAIDNNSHKEVCRDCDEVLSVAAHSARFSKVDNYYHRKTCYDCSYELGGLTNHTFIPGRFGMTSICSGCGYETSGPVDYFELLKL